MPPHDLPAYVQDIVHACKLVVEYAEGFDVERFIADSRTMDAIERRLFIIGEAMTQIHRLDEAIADSLGPSDRIIAFRNILAHGYFFVDPQTVWRIVKEHVPPLLIDAEALLSTLPLPDSPPEET